MHGTFLTWGINRMGVWSPLLFRARHSSSRTTDIPFTRSTPTGLRFAPKWPYGLGGLGRRRAGGLVHRSRRAGSRDSVVGRRLVGAGRPAFDDTEAGGDAVILTAPDVAEISNAFGAISRHLTVLQVGPGGCIEFDPVSAHRSALFLSNRDAGKRERDQKNHQGYSRRQCRPFRRDSTSRFAS
jgi:hypothetical protein